MKNRIIKRILMSIPMIVMMMIIGSFSSGTGEESGSLSLKITIWFSELLNNINITPDIEMLHILIRKCAHMTEYALLSITAIWALYGIKRKIIFGYVIAVIYAVTDELHQLYVPGRSGNITDVFIDAFGALIGIMVYVIIKRLCNSKRNSKINQ